MNIYELLRLLVLRPTRMTEQEMGAALALIEQLENVAAFGTLTTNTQVEVHRKNIVPPKRKTEAEIARHMSELNKLLERLNSE